MPGSNTHLLNLRAFTCTRYSVNCDLPGVMVLLYIPHFVACASSPVSIYEAQ
jgi:hypothetical protein